MSLSDNSSESVNKIAPKAVAYARVSSKEQEREGFSIPAQQKLINEYVVLQGIKLNKSYVDIETAKQSGRREFNEMVTYLKRHKTVRLLLVEKTDRLYRNLKDWVTIDELGVEIHFVKEGTVLSNESRSSEKFMHGIKVLMAKNYIDNLSEETRKGMIEKAEQGIWPTYAPMGYLNIVGPNGKKIIEIDTVKGPFVSQLYEWYSSGKYSLRELGKKARQGGFSYRKSGAPVSTSTIQKILRNRIYTGIFEWKGKLYKGSHSPLITHEEWIRVQGILDGRKVSKIRGSVHNFAFSGLISCGHCGCAMVGEIKKNKYIYYHCTGNKGKCKEPYTREEELGRQFSENLSCLKFDDDVFEWIKEALTESFSDEKREYSGSIERLTKEHHTLQNRIDRMYIDKLDEKVDQNFYDKNRFEWREQQDRCLSDIERLQNVENIYMDEGIQLLRLAKDAHSMFQNQSPADQSKMLNLFYSNCSWKRGVLSAKFRQPFDLLAETAIIDDHNKMAGIIDSDPFEKWLPEQDSNLRQID